MSQEKVTYLPDDRQVQAPFLSKVTGCRSDRACYDAKQAPGDRIILTNG